MGYARLFPRRVLVSPSCLTPTFAAKTCLVPVAVERLRTAYSLERLVALLMLVVLSPFILLTAIVICALSRCGPLVRHTRVGWQGRPLRMLKLRTMWDRGKRPGHFRLVEDVTSSSAAAKQVDDHRINSRFAAFCRRYSLDELPQLCHVVRGEMSLVGPRPITRAELEEHYGGCMEEVLSLRPGLTGLWQVMGRNSLTYSTRRRLDLILVRNASVSLYLRVLLLSIPCVLNGKGAF
jgi:exopolysaccharide production protein ExoY